MKSLELVCFFFFSLLVFASLSSSDVYITGKIITGKASFDGTGVFVSLQGVPALLINFPENKTYLKRNLLINYSASGGGGTNVTYSVDGASNVTLSGPTFNVFDDLGVRHLELYADNGLLNRKEAFFTVNTSLLQINYTDFNGSLKGESTDFYDYAYEDLLNLSGIVLENTNYGKVEFKEDINLEDDSNSNDGFVEINDNIIFGTRSLNVKSSNLPNFNKSANITFYSVSYSNPQILIDGSVCPANVCTELSYGGGTYVFSTTHFSDFTLRDTPAEEENTPSSGGGGGGGSPEGTFVDFKIILPDLIEMATDDSIVVPVILRNDDKSVILKNIKLRARSTTPGVLPSFENIVVTQLRPGQEQEVMLFITTKDAELGDFKIEIEAIIGSPSFSITESLFLDSVSGITRIKTEERIILAQELFKNNPECSDLEKEMILAIELFNKGELADSRVVVQEAILRCRELVSHKEYPSTLPKSGSFFKSTGMVLAILLILLIILVLLKKIRKHKKFLKPAKKSHKH